MIMNRPKTIAWPFPEILFIGYQIYLTTEVLSASIIRAIPDERERQEALLKRR
jgi:hypothetical protein